MDTARMLAKCEAQQWRVEDLNWGGKPRAMSRDEEIAVVRYFKDMAGIERFAAALFEEQGRVVRDPTLKKIFATFVVDEERHAVAAERLAAYYDVHRYEEYRESPELARFRPHFLSAVRFLSPEIANAYITGGELLLDVALLRSLNDYVHDEMSDRAMTLINRDESRHIAIDYYMTEYYASREYQAWLAEQPSKPLSHHLTAWRAFASVLITAGPFFQKVFFQPMARVDPSGRRTREAVKRMQLLGRHDGVAERPFYRFMNGIRSINQHPVLGRLFGKFSRRLGGNFPDELSRDLFDAGDLQRANRMTMEELAQEALQVKNTD